MFIQNSRPPPCLWEHVETGNWEEDNRTGRDLALDCLQHIQVSEQPAHLGWVIKAMISKGRFGGIEVGFCHVIAVMATE